MLVLDSRPEFCWDKLEPLVLSFYLLIINGKKMNFYCQIENENM